MWSVAADDQFDGLRPARSWTPAGATIHAPVPGGQASESLVVPSANVVRQR